MSKVKLITSQLLPDLVASMEGAKSIYILTSFVMKSGVSVLAPYLKQAAEAGADIKICTGDYLYITQPEALQALYEIHPSLEIRLWHSAGKSFHPKAYLFEAETGGVLIVGSSNMSRSALTSGVEWSLFMDSEVSPETFSEAVERFLEVHLHEATVPVNLETIKRIRSSLCRMRGFGGCTIPMRRLWR